jgi:hypothetical protein
MSAAYRRFKEFWHCWIVRSLMKAWTPTARRRMRQAAMPIAPVAAGSARSTGCAVPGSSSLR